MHELIIDDAVNTDDPALNAGPCGTRARDFRWVPVGSIPGAAAAAFPLIPRDEWADRIRQMERDKSRLSDVMRDCGIKSFNQMQTNFCHANSPAMAIQVLRAVQGQPFVLLSPASIAGPVTGYRNEGAYIHQDLQQITTVGCASQQFVPANQVSRDGFRDGWEENARQHRVTEWWDLGERDGQMFDRVMTLLLSRIPVCTAHNWWAHAVLALDPVLFDDGTFGTRDINSWGDDYPGPGAGGYFRLREGKGTPDEAYAPRSIVVAE